MLKYIKIENEFLTEPEYIPIFGEEYVKTVDTTVNTNKTYYYIDDGQYVKFEGQNFVSGVTYYELIEANTIPINGLWLVKMDNIGEIAATINTTDYAIADGAFRNTNRVSKRNITLKFRLVESYANKWSGVPKNIEQSRLRLYRLFPYKSEIKLTIKTDTSDHVKIITGYTESVEPDVFSNKETVSVSLICPDPYFIMDKEVAIGRGFNVPYNGSASTGIILNLDCGVLSNNKDFSIAATNGNHITELRFSIEKIKQLIGAASVLSGYRLYVSSELGNKFVQMSDGIDDPIDVMSALGIGPFGWPYFYQGINHLTVKIDGNEIPESGLPEEDIIVITDDTEKPSGFDSNEMIVKFKERYGGI